MGKKLFLYLFLLMSVLTACNGQSGSSDKVDVYRKYALNAFIENRSLMTERDALSKGIEYYQDPKLAESYFLGTLSGKDIISICNKIEKENESKENDLRNHLTWIIKTFDVSDIKNYALNHPNDAIAYKYHFAATFTTYNRQKPYIKESNDVIVVLGINHILILSDGSNFVTYEVSEFEPNWYEIL